MRTCIASVLSSLVFVVACGGTPSSTPVVPTSAAVGTGSAEPVETAPTPTPTSKLTKVIVVYHRMTYVMDSPSGQKAKAEAAVRKSGLVSELAGLGLELEYKFDEASSDDVVITDPDGSELARAELHGLEGKGVADDVIARVKARM
ncbi:MAG: hypothetical protein NT062_03550 [Proteobacteria bacterium]|nr:hypothetical protein [Pseudomonadota bacterium]